MGGGCEWWPECVGPLLVRIGVSEVAGMEGLGGADGESRGRHGVGCSWFGSVVVSSGVLDERTS